MMTFPPDDLEKGLDHRNIQEATSRASSTCLVGGNKRGPRSRSEKNIWNESPTARRGRGPGMVDGPAERENGEKMGRETRGGAQQGRSCSMGNKQTES